MFVYSEIYTALFIPALLSLSLASDIPKSVSVITFDDDNNLFVADSESATVFIYPNVEGEGERLEAYNLWTLGGILADFLGTSQTNVLIKDLAIHPKSKEAYIAVHKLMPDSCEPAIVIVNQDGKPRLFDLNMKREQFKFKDTPRDFTFWNLYPIRHFVFTDMEVKAGKVYVSGLSNGDFSATMRVFSYPLGQEKQSVTSIEMYHGNHGQNETRAPIRTFKIVQLNGKDHIVAAYTCTPLVVFPLDDLKDGAHITGKTIAELGFGNTPIDLIAFNSPPGFFAQGDVLLLTNKQRSAQVITVEDIAESAAKPGLLEMANFQVVGVKVQDIPLTSTVQTSDQDDMRLAVIRKDMESNQLQLVSFTKNTYFRKSDFVSEFDFPDYEYPSWVPQAMIDRHKVMKEEEGNPQLDSGLILNACGFLSEVVTSMKEALTENSASQSAVLSISLASLAAALLLRR